MTKRIAALLAVCMLALSGAAMAEGVNPVESEGVIDIAEMSLSGVHIGMSRAEVEEILGEPTLRTKPYYAPAHDTWRDSYNYEWSLNVDFDGDSVMSLGTNKRNGIATPAGLEVGDTVEKMQRIYGKGYHYFFFDQETFEYHNNGAGDYAFYDMKITASNGIITEIDITSRES
ncbi:hypothetical protein TAMA11512_00610 [Selenomonas sp. TAMA-11512]|uniref:hypothetical protein n=1 Tax=Selenomonas sp. TAMA-11512 TaxID=3095337 RepID=UPI0030860388|nr:hypothetical protein TAMA11512_00610 [Selenomonas sp. TAMA-11512]